MFEDPIGGVTVVALTCEAEPFKAVRRPRRGRPGVGTATCFGVREVSRVVANPVGIRIAG